MQNVATSSLGTRQALWPSPLPPLADNKLFAPTSNFTLPRGLGSRRNTKAPLRRSDQLSTLIRATTSEIIADVLNEEHKRTKPASLLELLDRQGWGVTADITRKLSTRFASVTLEASWDDDPTGRGRQESRRLAVLAVYQEWLVGRSCLVGRLVDSLERLRPGYLPRELLERVRSSRSASLLTPESEALDGPSLLLLAALVVPPDQLTRALDGTLADARAELLASPAYRGRDDLVPSLDRGLLLLRSSAVRSLHMALFRATHIREARELEAELRRLKRSQQPKRDEATSGVLGMWFRGPKPASAASAAASGPDASARAANERLYAGQLAPEAAPWMAPGERAAAAMAAAPVGRSGPRGLPGGRVGVASFRPLPGAALYSDPGGPGSCSFGSSDRLSFALLDGAVVELLSRADYQVPAAALSAFARLHRTSLLDLLSAWQWEQLAGAEAGAERAETDRGAAPAAAVAGGGAAASRGGGAAGGLGGGVRGFYQPRCSHATSLRPPGPLQVSRRTRLDVAPGPELEALRALARRRGAELLSVVHPLARKQVVSQGEWEYWRDAYRLWDRYAAFPPYCRTTSMTLVLTPEQVPYVGLLEAEAAGRAAAASVAVPPPPPGSSAADDIDMSSLTSMSSLDFDDAPLPGGLTIPASSAATATTTTTTTTGGGAGSGAVAKPTAQTETTVQIFVPPEELRRFLLVLLDLLPSHVGEGAAAAAAAVAATAAAAAASPLPDVGSRGSGGLAATAAAAPGEWLPADSTTVQIRYSPVGAAGGGPAAAGSAARVTVSSSSAAPFPTATPSLPEERQPSCYELRWALGSAAVTTAPSGPSAATAFSRISSPPSVAPRAVAAPSPQAVAAAAQSIRWCAPLRLTQAHLLSLVNIFTDLAKQLPDLYGVQPQRLVVPTLSPLERLTSALQAAAGSVVRAAGLLALLAVPLAAAVKAGGGDLKAMMAAAPGGGGAAAPGGLAAAVRSVQLPRRDAAAAPRAAPSAEAADAEAVEAAAAAATSAPAAGVSAAELAALCRGVEAPLEGRMWLEVSGTAAAGTVTAGVLPHWLEATADPTISSASFSWPEFQLVVDRRSGAVVGCRPVNAAARAVLAELPTAAALRGRAAEKAVAGHLGKLTRERIERGKPTPGRFDMPYRAARFTKLPTSASAPLPLSAASTANAAAGSAAPPAAAASPAAATSHVDTPQLQTQPPQPHPRTSAAPDSTCVAATPSEEAVAEAAASPATSPDGALALGPSPRPADGHRGASAQAAEASLSSTAAGEAGFTSPTQLSWAAPESVAAQGTQRLPAAPVAAPQSGAPVVVLKLELRPSLDPARHAVQGKAGKNQREFAQADVVVRPWYDSDSLLCWLEDGVQLPSLAEEMGAGLLAAEEKERAAFLQAYERLTGRAAAAAAVPLGSVATEAVQQHYGDGVERDAAEKASEARGAGRAAEGSSGLGGAGGGAAGGGDGPILRPQELSEQQLQEALQQLLISLGVPERNVRLAPGGAGGGGGGAATPASSAEGPSAASAPRGRGPG